MSGGVDVLFEEDLGELFVALHATSFRVDELHEWHVSGSGNMTGTDARSRLWDLTVKPGCGSSIEDHVITSLLGDVESSLVHLIDITDEIALIYDLPSVEISLMLLWLELISSNEGPTLRVPLLQSTV